jgi:hypothetical protein
MVEEPAPRTEYTVKKPTGEALAPRCFRFFRRRKEKAFQPPVEDGETRQTMVAFLPTHTEETERTAQFASSHSAAGYFVENDPRETVAAGFKKYVPGSGIVINPAVALYDWGVATYWGARYGYARGSSVASGVLRGLGWAFVGFLEGIPNLAIRTWYGKRKYTTAQFIENSRKDVKDRPWQYND